MAKEFSDIKIVAMDDKASGPSGEGALMRIVLKLSDYPPGEWSDYFAQLWKQHLYMAKRGTNIFGDNLEIVCMPDELQSDHIPELNKVIAETNAAYRKYAAERAQIQQAEQEKANQQRQGLAELKKGLKFD